MAACETCKHFAPLSPGHAAICLEKWKDCKWNDAVPLTDKDGWCDKYDEIEVSQVPGDGRARPPQYALNSHQGESDPFVRLGSCCGGHNIEDFSMYLIPLCASVFILGFLAGALTLIWQASRPGGYAAINGGRYKLTPL